MSRRGWDSPDKLREGNPSLMLNMRFFYTANRARGNSTSKSLVRALIICCNAPVEQKADLARTT